jgi:hypothetical protein
VGGRHAILLHRRVRPGKARAFAAGLGNYDAGLNRAGLTGPVNQWINLANDD